ncbi:MAG TPA: phosphoribosylamine--glycine ligase [Acidimicrobiales bacterium]|nr:phosphoribosylamine--glycine ligase [Acidimicrobiales bacterium]
MKTVVVGGDGRAHVLAHVLARTSDVVATPGNPGIASIATCVATPPEEIDGDLFVISAEAPLVDGLADRLRAQGKRVFGPGADGARLEGSKIWMKEFFAAIGIPTARHGAFDDADEAIEFLKTLPGGYVVKTDGLAAGKGVFVTRSIDEAVADVVDKLAGTTFGDAGRRIVIEEEMTGPELSILAVCDGTRVVPLTPAQDFKRIGDGDTGPNTGGMGAYSPVPVAGKDIVDQVLTTILEPTVVELCRRGIDYRGVLYAGLMLTPEGPKMVEYNVRFGDPEAQVVLTRFDGDLAAFLAEAADGELLTEPRFTDTAAVTVVLAGEGYPASSVPGEVITGIDEAEQVPGVTVFHAATAWADGALVTAGGRVLDVTATGSTIGEARRRAYEAVARIGFRGMQFRSDIAGERTGVSS